MQANAFRTAGQVVVSTPGRIAQALESGIIQTALLSKTLSMFVVDEADLLLLHEYESDLQAIAPQVTQAVWLDVTCWPDQNLYAAASDLALADASNTSSNSMPLCLLYCDMSNFPFLANC